MNTLLFHFPPVLVLLCQVWTTKWQLLFPQQPCGNHDGKTRLHPPVEENKTRRRRVNTRVQRERQGRGGGGGTRQKMEAETKRERRGGEGVDGELQSVRGGRQNVNETAIWGKSNKLNKLRGEEEVMESALTQIHPVGWGRRQEVTRYIDCPPLLGLSVCLHA